MTERWPHPPLEPGRQAHFLFLITPPYSGSTAIAALLNSSPYIALLQERGEGQWLVPGLCESDRWDAAKEVDYASVKAVWLNRWQQVQKEQPTARVIIEKSPPNMVRIDALAALFSDVSYLANNRDPYANCASILYRNHQAEQLASDQRLAVLQKLAAEWLLRSEKIRELVCRLDIPLLGYEEFCANPAALTAKLVLGKEVRDSIDVLASVKVKDYPVQGIVNQNERQLALLDSAELSAIGEVLKPHAELLDFFGYELL